MKTLKKGFTLIELLIVISIIGILAVALLPNILSAPATARDAGRKAQLNSVLSALEQYKASNGSYPGAAGTATELPSTLDTFFKGSAAPRGAAVTTSESVTGVSVLAAADSPIIYCPLAANNGYSYVVAIRMEQSMNDVSATSHALDITKTCASMVASGAYVSPKIGSSTSNWYFLAQ